MTKELNPLAWFGTRQVNPAPRHFIKTTTPMTNESKEWVMTKLNGRYSLVDYIDPSMFLNNVSYICFEDPAEAMYYELRWSGEQNNSLS